MGANDPHGVATLWLMKKIFFMFSHDKSMGAKDYMSMANFNPRGMVGRIYVGNQKTLLHTNHLSYGPHGFREEDFLSFSHYKSMEAICCHGNQSFNPISPKPYAA